MRCSAAWLGARWSLCVIAVGVLALMGCSSRHEVSVQVRTDFAPGVDFDRVVLERGGAWVAVRYVDATVRVDRPWVLAEIGDIEPGTRLRLRVSLERSGEPVYDRTIDARIDTSRVILFVLSSACRVVSCPPEDDPTATECVEGVCVTPGCEAPPCEAEPDAATVADDASVAECEDGDARCVGAERQLCMGGVFGTTEVCEGSAGCTPGGCLRSECVPRTGRCDGTTFERCSDDGSRYTAQVSCLTAALCTPTGCASPACAVGELRCRGTDRERCNVDRTGFQRVEVCATEELCSPSRCDAPACAAGERRCRGATREECNPGRTGWSAVQSCLTAGLCSPVGCALPACAVGARRCSGNRREVCNPERTDWDLVETCGACTECTALACLENCD